MLIVSPGLSAIPQRKRVAAYARVSSDKDAMLHSLSAQISYYSEMIQRVPDWQYAGVYVDAGFTGTINERPDFQRMVSDCRAGKLDMLITKTVSRFARNTVTLLETVRELKNIGIDIYFEEQKIHTISGEGELMLSLLASFAQEESRSGSENCKWRIRKDFEQGKVGSITLLGYRRNSQGGLEIEPSEAQTVRSVFSSYLNGMGKQAIANMLNDQGIPTRRGMQWHAGPVHKILTNEKYIGDMLLQKMYRENHLTKKSVLNDGVLPQYYVEDSHEPIIDRETFAAVQTEMGRRSARHCKKKLSTTSIFTGCITCGCCGKHYHRKLNAAGTKYEKPVWICATYNKRGKKHCLGSKQIPEDILLEMTAGVLGVKICEASLVSQRIKGILVAGPNEVVYQFQDAKDQIIVWRNRPRNKTPIE